FTLNNWQSCLADTLAKTAIFIVIMTGLKAMLIELEIIGEPLFSFPHFHKYSFLFALAVAITYSIFSVLQEIVLRSALQHSLMHFLTGRYAKIRIIATTTLIAAATHLHLKSIWFPLIIIMPNIFWCMLYYKHRSLIGVSVSHILIGVWALFILGIPWQ
ncbi:MAG TPA: CPBP family glutamic-type intramembrane protease, partial [Terrimicrobiaceae bacterium]